MDNKQAVELLKAAVATDTTHGNESAMAELIIAALKKNSIHYQQLDYAEGRGQLIAELSGGDGGRALAFGGYMDTEPTGALPWEYLPFGGIEADGRVYGRGASGSKSGLVAMAVAMIRLKQQGCPFNGTIRLLASAAGAQGSLGAKQLTEKGHANGLDAMVLAAPTGNKTAVAQKGMLVLRLTTYGRSAHSALPSAGVNAIDHMLALLNGLRERFNMDKYKHPLFSPPTAGLSMLRGGTGSGIIPDKCVAELAMHTIPHMDNLDLIAHTRQHIREAEQRTLGLRAELEVVADLPPVATYAREEIVRLSVSAGAEITNRKCRPGSLAAHTDAARYTRAQPAFPMVMLGPGKPEMDRRTNEYVSIADYLRAIDIYTIIAMDYLK